MGRMLEWGPGEWAYDETTAPVPGYASVFYLARGGKRIRVRVPDSAIKRAPAAPEVPVVPAVDRGVFPREERAALEKQVRVLCSARSFSPAGLEDWLKLASDGEIEEWLAKAEVGGK